MLTDDDKQEVGKIVVQALEEVILPVLEDMATKEDLKHLETRMDQRMDSLETRVGQMDRKMDLVTDKVILHDNKIKKLEQITVTA